MDSKLMEGETLFADGKIEDAEKFFLDHFEEDAENPEILNNLGVISHVRGNLKEAEDYFLNAIGIKEDYSTALLNLANLYCTIKDWEKAVGKLEKCVSSGSQDCNTYNLLGTVYLEQGNIEKARQALLKSLEINPDQAMVKESLEELDRSGRQTEKPIGYDNLHPKELIHNTTKPVPLKDAEKYFDKKPLNIIKQNCRKILIVMDEGIGNMVMLEPTIKAIKEQLPGIKITILGRQPSVQLLEGWDLVEKVLTEPDDEGYDIGFLSIWSKSYEHKFKEKIDSQCKIVFKIERDNVDTHESKHHLIIAGFFGYEGKMPEPYCKVNEIDIQLPTNKKIVALSDTAQENGHWERKRWPYYKELSKELIDRGYAVVLIGGNEESRRFGKSEWPSQVINCLGKFNVQETAGILKKCSMFIGNDSGPAHMAAAIGIKTFVLFGPTRISKNKPLGPDVHVVTKDLQCSPCQYTRQWNECSDWKCMSSLKVEDVIENVVSKTVSELSGERNPVSTAHNNNNPVAVAILPQEKVFQEDPDIAAGAKPKTIQIQTMTRCNGVCHFCPYPKVSDKITHGTIDDSLFKKIVNQCRDLEGIAPYLMNEPLLDKKLPERVRYIKDNTENAHVYISTNGELLTKPLADKLIDAGLDEFMFSITAGKYSEDIIKYVRDQGIKKLVLTYICTKKTAPYLEDFRKKFEGFEISVGLANNRGGNVEAFKDFDLTGYEANLSKQSGLCGKIMRQLYVLYNGDCVLCCSDYHREVILGNFRDHTIEEIWNSKMMRMYRKLQAQKKRRFLPLCNSCSFNIINVPLTKKRKKLVAMLRIKDSMLTIKECLDNLSSFADEIVIVDNGSTDGTLEAYKEYQKIVDVTHTTGFNEGRDKNLALEMAKKRNPDWIIWIDSDEVFEQRMTRELVEKYMDQDQYTSIWFKQYHFWRNKTHYRVDDRWKPNYQRTMWQNQPDTFFSSDKIHNSLIQGVKGKAFGSDIRLKHYGHVLEQATRQRYEQYRRLDNPESANWTGRTYKHMIDESTVQLDTWNEDFTKDQNFSKLTSLRQQIAEQVRNCLKNGQLAEAEGILIKALASTPNDAVFLNYLGVIQYNQGKIEMARETLEKALSFDLNYSNAAENLKKVRLDLIKKRIDHAISEYSLREFTPIAAFIDKVKMEYAKAQTVSTSVSKRLREQGPKKQDVDNRKNVLFISANPRVDMAKKADALRQTGKYKVTLLCSPAVGILDGFFSRFFDETIVFSNLLELIDYLLVLTPDIIISRPKEQIAVLAIIFSKSPVIVNIYDSEIINDPDPNSIKVIGEKFCFKNAAGVIHKGAFDEIDKYVRPKCEVRSPVLHFPPFCWDRYYTPEISPKLSDKDGMIRLVYIGMVSPSSQDKRFCSHTQFAPMIEEITRQGIHLHMYYNPETGVNDAHYQEYFDIDKQNPYFHFHSPLPCDKLNSEMASYDYGINIIKIDDAIWTRASNNVSTTNKQYNYIEAGLPIITGNTFRAIADFVDEHSVGIVVDPTDLSDLSERLKSVDYKKLKANVEKARKELSLNGNIYKLHDFIEKITKTPLPLIKQEKTEMPVLQGLCQ